MRRSTRQDPRRLWLADDCIRYQGARTLHSIPISKLRLIGELTTPGGPLLDDYFVCFVPGPEEWLEISIDVTGVEQCMEQLRDLLQAPLAFSLANSTVYATRILWPVAYVGKPMLEFDPTKRAGVLGRVLDWLGGTSYSVSMSIEALAAMESDQASH